MSKQPNPRSQRFSDIYSALRRRGFVRVSRSRSEHLPHVYEWNGEYDGKPLTFTAQVWSDGRHRISHGWAGCQVVPPTEFGAASEVRAAFDDQRGKVHLTQEHVQKVNS